MKTVDFVIMLWNRRMQSQTLKEPDFLEREGLSQMSAVLRRARKEGWLEEQDLLEADGDLDRRCAAAILHRFLRNFLGESDASDISAAYVLRDLYDCRVCANHIAQVYVKGIMEALVCPGPKRENQESGDLIIFDSGGTVSLKEAETYIERVFDVQKRRQGMK